MTRTRIVALLLLTAITAALAVAWMIPPSSAGQGAAPVILLEATSRHWGIGGYDPEFLFLRLRNDGKIEWDERVERGVYKRHSGVVDLSVVSEFQRAIDELDRNKVQKTMGPYHRNMDTGDELRLRVRMKSGEIRFKLLNPWYARGPLPERLMPSDVPDLFCQIDNLYSQNTKQKADQVCTGEK